MEFLLIFVTSALWRIGGAGKEEIKFAAAWYRDLLIPIINFLYYLLTANLLTAILTGGATNSIRIGYGAYDPEHDSKPSWLAKITKDRKGWKIRMIYGLITSLAIGLFPSIHYHAWGGLFVYVFINVAAEYVVNTTKGISGNVWIVELVLGGCRGLVFVLCR